MWGDNDTDRIYGGTGNDLVYGGAASDFLSGSTGGDTIFGDDGNDRINGGGSTDRLYGGKGNDLLTGVNGRDFLRGGGGADTFDFNRTTESQSGHQTRDLIFDFTQGTDRIDLRGIDADATRGGNQAFEMIGSAGFTDAGQVRSWQRGDDRIVQINTDNNLNTVEMEIELRDMGRVFASDFLL